MENTIMNNVEVNAKKVSLSGPYSKYMVFGNWLIARQVASGLMSSDSIVESRKLLAMFSGVDEQISLYDGFSREYKEQNKEVKAIIRQHNKPPPKAKVKVEGDNEKKRGRKKKDVVVEAADPITTLNAQLVAAAQSDEPIVPVVFVRAAKAADKSSENELDKASEKELDKASETTVDKASKKELDKASKKELDKAAKAAEKASKKELDKATKAAEKELDKATKAAEKAANKGGAKKGGDKKVGVECDNIIAPAMPVLQRTIVIDDDTNSIDGEEELECEIFEHNGIEYLIDDELTIYDRDSHNVIGKYIRDSKTIKFNAIEHEMIMGH